jgi:DNA-directed RNA polymerase subunit RPC12/RpoP
MKCFVCGKKVDPKDDPFEQFTVTDSTMCKDCKSRLEAKQGAEK